MESESGPGPEQELLLDETQIRQIMGVPHLASEGMYEDILPGVDLHYTIEGERIKENIRLKTKEAAGYPARNEPNAYTRSAFSGLLPPGKIYVSSILDLVLLVSVLGSITIG